MRSTKDVIRVHENRVNVPYHQRIRAAHLSPQQMAEFENSSQQFANAESQNQMLKKELEILRANYNELQPSRADQEKAQHSVLQSEIAALRSQLSSQSQHRDALRAQVTTEPQVNVQEVEDRTGLTELESDISLLRQKNQELTSFISSAQGNRAEVSHHRQIQVAATSQLTTRGSPQQMRVSTSSTSYTPIPEQQYRRISPPRVSSLSSTLVPRHYTGTSANFVSRPLPSVVTRGVSPGVFLGSRNHQNGRIY